MKFTLVVVLIYLFAIALWALGILWGWNDFIVPNIAWASHSIDFWNALIPATLITMFRRPDPQASKSIKELQKSL